jgi:hypothetical protein
MTNPDGPPSSTHRPIEPTEQPPTLPPLDREPPQDGEPDDDQLGEQWSHDEGSEQAVISAASRQPGGVQRSTTA